MREQVKRVFVAERQNAIVNRLNKTKMERQVDHEAERIERQKVKDAEKRAEAARLEVRSALLPGLRKQVECAQTERKAQDKAWKDAKAARSYDAYFSEEAMEEERSRRREEGDDDEDFM